jgi:predicted metal-dependent RNase
MSARLVRVVNDGRVPFVAGFVTDGIVRVAAPILRKHLMGRTDEQARAIIRAKGWRASVVSPPPIDTNEAEGGK